MLITSALIHDALTQRLLILIGEGGRLRQAALDSGDVGGGTLRIFGSLDELSWLFHA